MEKYLINNSWFLTVFIYGVSLLILVLLVAFRVKISLFLREVRAELGKCSWPWDPEQTGLRKYKQLIDSTVIVIVSTILMAGYITGFDYVIGNLVGLLINF
ncbi:MAG: preprotein translocase subunit SecE [Candidatus Methylacidiphilales bacterium]